jgi:hypothetical protein
MHAVLRISYIIYINLRVQWASGIILIKYIDLLTFSQFPDNLVFCQIIHREFAYAFDFPASWVVLADSCLLSWQLYLPVLCVYYLNSRIFKICLLIIIIFFNLNKFFNKQPNQTNGKHF